MGFYEYNAAYRPPIPICQIYLGPGGSEATFGPMEAVIDTGADVTVIPTEYLNQINARRVSRGRARSLWGDARDVDIYAISLRVNGLQIPALQALADNQGDEIVLGRFVLNRLKIILDGPAAVTEIGA